MQKELLKSVLVEAQSFEPQKAKLPLTHCPVCGKEGHPPSAHQAKALAGENNQPVKEEDFKAWSAKSDAKGFKYSLKKKKLRTEDEAVKCASCGKMHAPSVPCSKKELLFGEDGVNEETISETKKYTHKIWTGPSGVKQYAAALHKHYPNTKAGTEHVYVHTNHPAEHVAHTLKNKLGMSGFAPGGRGWITKEHQVNENKMFRTFDKKEDAEKYSELLRKGGTQSWVNSTPDNKHHAFWYMKEDEVAEDELSEVKKPKAFNKGAHVRAIARNTIGAPKKAQIFQSKKNRKPKHKKQVMDEAELSAHEKAARLHDAAAEHAKGSSSVIDRPYKDAVAASFRTKHPEIEKHIRTHSSSWSGDPIPHFGGREKFHKALAQMHRDADKG